MRLLNLLVGSLLASLVSAAPQSPVWPRSDPIGHNSSHSISHDNSHTGINATRPGSHDHRIMVTKENTLNGTGRFVTDQIVQAQAASSLRLPLSFVNNFPGGKVNAYIQGKDTSGRAVFVKGDGSLLYPSSGGSEVPVPVDPSIAIPLPSMGGTLNMTIPLPIVSGRVYFCEGTLEFFVVSTPVGDGIVQPSVANAADPSAGLIWGFMEFTFNPDGNVFANISYVDFVGLLLSLSLHPSDGTPMRMTRGLGGDALEQICDYLVSQAGSDGFPWDQMCISNNDRLIRVVSPNIFNVLNSTLFKGYYSDYVDQVWSRFAQEPLRIDTQRSDIPFSNCTVTGDLLYCSDDNRSYPKPNDAAIFGCNTGSFAINDTDNDVHRANVPRICAALNRSTLLLPNGNVQPGPAPGDYYLTERTNHYSQAVHNFELDAKGYAFSYDDVNPTGHDDASGSIACNLPQFMTIYVGGSG